MTGPATGRGTGSASGGAEPLEPREPAEPLDPAEPTEPAEHPGMPPGKVLALVALLVVAPMLLIGAVAVFLVVITADDSPARAPRPAAAHGAVPADGSASCVARYSPDDLPPTLAGEQEPVGDTLMAFDGTVTAVGPPRTDRGSFATLGSGYATVTFDVTEWFAGGTEPSVTVEMQEPGPASGSGAGDDAAPRYGVGSRLLVMGARGWADEGWEDALGWGECGFVRHHDRATADLWRDRLTHP